MTPLLKSPNIPLAFPSDYSVEAKCCRSSLIKGIRDQCRMTRNTKKGSGRKLARIEINELEIAATKNRRNESIEFCIGELTLDRLGPLSTNEVKLFSCPAFLTV